MLTYNAWRKMCVQPVGQESAQRSRSLFMPQSQKLFWHSLLTFSNCLHLTCTVDTGGAKQSNADLNLKAATRQQRRSLFI